MLITQLNPIERKKLVRELTDGAFGQNFLLKKHLGSGGFGEVFIVKYIHVRMEPMVAKFVKNDNYNPNEAEILKKLQGHANIVQIHGVLGNRYYTQIIMALEGRTSYFDYLEQNSHLHEYHIRRFFYQMASAVSFMHALNIVHLDIKPDNMIMANDMTVKLIDFGLAKDLTREGNGPFPGYVGTSYYMAIEMLQGPIDSRCCPKPADIWALGVALFVSYFNAFPFRITRHLIMDQNGSPFLKVKRAYSSEFRDLIDRMTCLGYRRRITAEILNHDWITGNSRPNCYVKTKITCNEPTCQWKLFQTVSNRLNVSAEDNLDTSKPDVSFVEDHLLSYHSDPPQENSAGDDDMEICEIMNGQELTTMRLQQAWKSGRFVLPAIKGITVTRNKQNKTRKDDKKLKVRDNRRNRKINNKNINTVEALRPPATSDTTIRLAHQHGVPSQIQLTVNNTYFQSINSANNNNCTEMLSIVDHADISTQIRSCLQMERLELPDHTKSSKQSTNLQTRTFKYNSFTWLSHLLWIHFFYQMASSGFLNHMSDAVDVIAKNGAVCEFRSLLPSIFTISTTGRSKNIKQAIASGRCLSNTNHGVLIAIARFLSSNSCLPIQVYLSNAKVHVSEDFHVRYLDAVEYHATNHCKVSRRDYFRSMSIVEIYSQGNELAKEEYSYINFPGIICEVSQVSKLPDYEDSMIKPGEKDIVKSKEIFIETNGRDVTHYFVQDTTLSSNSHKDGCLQGESKEISNVARKINDNNNIFPDNEDVITKCFINKVNNQPTVPHRMDGQLAIDGKSGKVNVVSNGVEFKLPKDFINVNQLEGCINSNDGNALGSPFDDESIQKLKRGKSKNHCKKWWQRLKRLFCCHN